MLIGLVAFRKGRGTGTGERGYDGCAGCCEEESGGVDGERDVRLIINVGKKEAVDDGDGFTMVHTL